MCELDWLGLIVAAYDWASVISLNVPTLLRTLGLGIVNEEMVVCFLFPNASVSFFSELLSF